MDSKIYTYDKDGRDGNPAGWYHSGMCIFNFMFDDKFDVCLCEINPPDILFVEEYFMEGNFAPHIPDTNHNKYYRFGYSQTVDDHTFVRDQIIERYTK
jgi:hypothetical protein